MPPSPAPRRWSKRPTNGRSSRMRRWRRPAASPTCATARRPSGPARRSRITAREGVAKMLKLPVEKVKAVAMTGPGSYGRNDAGDAAMDAAVLSKAVGKPVRVQGMRYEGHGWDPKAPASVHISRAAVDKDGKVIGWQFETQSVLQARHLQQRRRARIHARRPAHGLPLQAGASYSVIRTSPTASRRCEKISATIAPLLDRASPLRTAHMRDPGGPQTHFAVESFMDELALGDQHGPGRVPAALPDQSARHRGDQGGGREGRLAAARRRRASRSRATSMSARASPMRRAAARASPRSPKSRSTATPARSGRSASRSRMIAGRSSRPTCCG